MIPVVYPKKMATEHKNNLKIQSALVTPPAIKYAFNV